tara:strand:+ start:861 stop:1760 length:900 start_codon:yes stop_codon:yes gene_type:complete
MKHFILKVIPYLVVFIAINAICLKTSGFYKQQHKYLERIDSSINSKSEIIFLGDSHVETIKLLDLSDNVGNLAFGADGIYEMYIKVLIMIKFNKSLKHVFIATEPQTFNNTTSPNSTFLNKYLLKVDDTLNVYNKTKLNLITEKAPLFNDSYINYVLDGFYSYFKPGKNKTKKNWATLTDLQRTEIATKTGVSDHTSVMTNTEFSKVYREIINLCKTNKINVIGIRFPVNENYINQCKKAELEKVDSFIKELNLDLNLDYSTRIKNPKYFDDEDHLNEKGIDKLSKIIFEDTNIKITNL